MAHETLLTPSTILLYGRELADLKFTYQPAPPKPARPSGNNFLEEQLKFGTAKEESDARLARIYGFSYEGHYYDLAKPAIFLVHGTGTDPDPPAKDPRQSTAPTSADTTGVANQEFSFAEDIKVWIYEKGDFSVRLDVETGPFEQILLEANSSPRGSYSGAEARISGAEARISGAEARISGAEARIRNR